MTTNLSGKKGPTPAQILILREYIGTTSITTVPYNSTQNNKNEYDQYNTVPHKTI
ncbi:MAG: hypothetical protein GY705_05715 [Bacteroidetes bacterium]|nr:hypothetical protein [Bacteroidota bacterium]